MLPESRRSSDSVSPGDTPSRKVIPAPTSLQARASRGLLAAKALLTKGNAPYLIILVLIGVVLASNWIDAGLPRGHDALAFVRAEAIRDSIFRYHVLPEWTTLRNLGSPVGYLEQPLVSAVHLLLALLFGWVVSCKLLYFSIFLLAGISAYYYVHELVRTRPAAFVAALVYTVMPFHLIEVVYEGHWGIGLGYALLPLAFLCTDRAIALPKLSRIVAAGAVLALLILSDPQTFPILVGPFWLLYCAFRVCSLRSQKRLAGATAGTSVLLLGLCLTAFWWLPLFKEISYLHPGYPSDWTSGGYSATPIQAITLRPDSCCASSAAYQLSDGILAQLVSWIPVLLVAAGIAANLRNRYVWFFTLSVAVVLPLALGTRTPVFEFARDHLPFFGWTRTPMRFLLFSSFAYSFLAGLGVESIRRWISRFRRPRTASILIVVALSVAVIANSWHDCRSAFSTFRLTDDDRAAIDWLSNQEDGRIVAVPLEPYVYRTDSRNTINPIGFSWIHGKETVTSGTFPGEFLGLIRDATRQQGVNIGPICDFLGIHYLAVDKTDPTSARYLLDDTFALAWTSQTRDVYRHSDPYPRVFACSFANQRSIDFWDGEKLLLNLVDPEDGTSVAADRDHCLSVTPSVMTLHEFSSPDAEWSALSISTDNTLIGQSDYLNLYFYSDRELPDIFVSLDLFETDGSRYGIDIDADAQPIKAGWNEFSVPVSLLSLRQSTDENSILDFDQAGTVWFGTGERKNPGKPHMYALYFDHLSVASLEKDADVNYRETRPGYYRLEPGFGTSQYLILAESYYPTWVLRTGHYTVSSTRMFQSVNGWEASDVGDAAIVTLEFTVGWQRVAGRICSLLALLAVISLLAIPAMWRHGRKALPRPESKAARPSESRDSPS